MVKRMTKLGWTAAAILTVMALSSAARGEDFLSALFGAFGGVRPYAPMTAFPYANEGYIIVPQGEPPQRQRPLYSNSYTGGSQAYCVRTCDGRYFPISSSGNQSKAASCNSFCPATETRVVYGSDIENAVTESGKPYSELPNAFRYRDELVAGCTCNGKDPVGLAAVRIENDPTLRKGDIVAGSSGLMVDGRGAYRHGASLQLTPAPESVRSHYRRPPVVASQ